jgi:hypothetical protein
VHIEKGLHPTWTADAAAADAYAELARYERTGGPVLAEPRILSVDGVSGRNVPHEEFGCCEPANSVRWIVHARGTFYNHLGGPSPGRVFFGTDGWYLYEDDGSGMVVGYAFNPIPPDLGGHLTGDPAIGCAWLVDHSGVAWQVDWPSGWGSTFDTDGNVVLQWAGRKAATPGSEVEVTGKVVDREPTCPAATKVFSATSVVYYSFGPEN